jgi:hypothetical protein
LGTGAKIAIGCAAVGVVAVFGIAATGIVGVWWAKKKVKEVTAPYERLNEYHEKANAQPFTPPADGVIQEARLQKFLEIRKRVHEFYLQHKDEIDALSKQKQGDLSSLTKGIGILGEAQVVRVRAQADLGMSDAEYAYLVASVYKSWMASNVAKENDGKQLSQVLEEAQSKSAESLRETQKQLATQPTTDSPGAEETQKALKEGVAALQQQADEAKMLSKSLDVPAANIALFRKYQSDIEKYSMRGMEFLGL